GGDIDGRNLGSYAISPDGLRLAAAVKRAGWMVAMDEKEMGPYDEIQGLRFSPDSRRLAFYSRRGKIWRVVLDGVEQPEFPPDSIVAGMIIGGQLAFSPDSQHLAYIAYSARGRGHVVVDGRAWPEYVRFGHPVFSPNSEHVAVACYRPPPVGGMVVLLDGKEVGGTESWESASFAFRPSRSDLVAVGGLGGGFACFGMKVDQDPNHRFATLASYKGDSGPYIRWLNFSEDGAHWSYALGDFRSFDLYMDGRSVYYGAGSLSEVRLSRDGNRLAALVSPPGGILDFKLATDPATGLKKVLELRKHEVVSGGLLSGSNWLSMSPGGRHLAYVQSVTHRRTKEHWLVIDGQEGPHFQEAPPYLEFALMKPVWISEDQVAYLGGRDTAGGPAWYRVVQRAPAQEMWTPAAKQ
ncbi:MAG: PD40 domain-containing protein, partial [Acidobacteriota bacterium]|nr:PD40 domain-containing protein [Acidobacteriota bacterium]